MGIPLLLAADQLQERRFLAIKTAPAPERMGSSGSVPEYGASNKTMSCTSFCLLYFGLVLSGVYLVSRTFVTRHLRG